MHPPVCSFDTLYVRENVPLTCKKQVKFNPTYTVHPVHIVQYRYYINILTKAFHCL
jgi:hypothetical protein